MAVLREVRKEADLTQRQLSKRLRRGPGHIQRIEAGDVTLSYLEAFDICQALGVDPFDFMDRVLSYGKAPAKIPPVVVTAKKRPKKKSS